MVKIIIFISNANSFILSVIANAIRLKDVKKVKVSLTLELKLKINDKHFMKKKTCLENLEKIYLAGVKSSLAL